MDKWEKGSCLLWAIEVMGRFQGQPLAMLDAGQALTDLQWDDLYTSMCTLYDKLGEMACSEGEYHKDVEIACDRLQSNMVQGLEEMRRRIRPETEEYEFLPEVN